MKDITETKASHQWARGKEYCKVARL